MHSFLQSKDWEKFQNRIGRKTWRIGGALVILHRIQLGFSYLYVPRPETENREQGATDAISHEIKKIAEKENAIFLKIDPSETFFIASFGIPAKKSDSLQPRHSLLVDLKKTKEKLLEEMHKKTRYNIRVAEKHGVEIKIFMKADSAAFEEFWNLLQETARRDSFSLHEKKYYNELLAANSADFHNALFCAFYNGRLSAAALVNVCGERATYLHGASSQQVRNVMAPYLLHWRIIEEAKKQRCAEYDLWGVDHARWPGITRFKMGFGGSEIMYPESVDIVYRPFWYAVYRVARKIL